MLTGGQRTTGLEDYLTTLFGRSVRIGRPMGMAGIADPIRGLPLLNGRAVALCQC